MTTESGKRKPVQSNPPERKRVKWAGERDRCQLCDKDISQSGFFDAPTMRGPWAVVCRGCKMLRCYPMGQEYDSHGFKIGG